MANTIRIKRSASTNTPSSLTQGELANSESGSPNGINELFVGTTGPTVTKIIRNLNAAPAEPTAGLADAVLAASDYLVFEDITDSQGKRELVSDISLSLFNDDILAGNYVTGVTAGVGLINSGTATAPVLDFDFSELTDMTASISGTTEFIIQDGTTESRKAASEIALSFFNNDAFIEGVTAGTGLSSTGTTTVTLDLDFSELTDMTGDIAGTTEFILQDGVVESRKAASEIELSKLNNDIQNIMGTYAFSTTTTAGDPGAGTLRFNNAAPASVTNIYIDDVEDNGNDFAWILGNLASNDILVIKSHVDAADYLIVQLNAGPTDNTGYWTLPVTVLFSGTLPTNADLLNLEVQWFSQGTAGTVTSVTAGTGLSNSGSSSAVVLDFDFSELTDMTGAISGTTEFILQDGTTESRKAASEIALSNFNNDSGWEVNQTLTTGVGISGANAGSSGSFTMALDFSELTDMTGAVSGTTEFILQDGATESRKAMSEITVETFDTSNFVVDEDNMVSDSDTQVPTQQSVKAYVDAVAASEMTYKGLYNASTNTPALDTGSPAINLGDMYYVSVAGSFFGSVDLEVGDIIIANNTSIDAAALGDWDIVGGSVHPIASESAAGIIEIADQSEVDAASSTVLAVVPNYLHNTTFDGGTF